MITLTREEAQQVLTLLETLDPFNAFTDVREPLRVKLSEPEPEPMTCKQCGVKGIHACVGYRWEEGRTPPNVTFTVPPQREWVGLTDEEIKERRISIGWSEDFMGDFARAIEAKLKEKNGN